MTLTMSTTTETRTQSPRLHTLLTPLLSKSDEKSPIAEIMSPIVDNVSPIVAKVVGLLHLHEIPEVTRDNIYLMSGYRPTAASLKHSLHTVFDWHNQTININSHLLGALVCLLLLPAHFYGQVYLPNEAKIQTIDLLLFLSFFIGAAICFAFSAAYHTFHNHACGPYVCQFDYLGIVSLVWGATLPSIYYAFPCDPSLLNFYWIQFSLFSLGTMYLTLHPRFDGPAFSTYRALLFSSLGASGAVYVFHGIALHGLELQTQRMSLDWFGLMSALNIAGACFYAARFPERIWPYTFDIVGASHQIFHLLVFIAALVHYVGLVKAVEYARLGPGAAEGACAVGKTEVGNVLGATADMLAGMVVER